MNKQVIKYLQSRLHIIHHKEFDTYKLVFNADKNFLSKKELNTFKEVFRIVEDDEK